MQFSLQSAIGHLSAVVWYGRILISFTKCLQRRWVTCIQRIGIVVKFNKYLTDACGCITSLDHLKSSIKLYTVCTPSSFCPDSLWSRFSLISYEIKVSRSVTCCLHVICKQHKQWYSFYNLDIHRPTLRDAISRLTDATCRPIQQLAKRVRVQNLHTLASGAWSAPGPRAYISRSIRRPTVWSIAIYLSKTAKCYNVLLILKTIGLILAVPYTILHFNFYIFVADFRLYERNTLPGWISPAINSVKRQLVLEKIQIACSMLI